MQIDWQNRVKEYTALTLLLILFMFQVCKYFDDYTDWIVGTYETREEAQKKLDTMPTKIYTTYEIRQF